ncbi:hypothetical protein [Dyella japonica]|uniref:hypothetical protein n=1 Tax=Dyella japonica TaxID=231455 RepID=UPI000300D887|nr:hypothetical protein [Dyella japonica]
MEIAAPHGKCLPAFPTASTLSAHSYMVKPDDDASRCRTRKGFMANVKEVAS